MKGDAIQSALHHAFKIDPGVLPKRRTPEGSPADRPGLARNETNPGADVQDAGADPNLTLACGTCNEEKGAVPAEVVLSAQPERQRQAPADTEGLPHGAAAVSVTHSILYEGLLQSGLPGFCFSDGRTGLDRARPGIPKPELPGTACVRETPALTDRDRAVLGNRALGRRSHALSRVGPAGPVLSGTCLRSRARGQVSRFEYPGGRPKAKRSADGLGTDGIVGATAPTGLRQGVRVGRVAAQAAGSFNTRAANGTVQGISYRYRPASSNTSTGTDTTTTRHDKRRQRRCMEHAILQSCPLSGTGFLASWTNEDRLRIRQPRGHVA